MMQPTTTNDTVYQQTEVVYQPTTEGNKTQKFKIKNPLKVPEALAAPDRSVSNYLFVSNFKELPLKKLIKKYKKTDF